MVPIFWSVMGSWHGLSRQGCGIFPRKSLVTQLYILCSHIWYGLECHQERPRDCADTISSPSNGMVSPQFSSSVRWVQQDSGEVSRICRNTSRRRPNSLLSSWCIIPFSQSLEGTGHSYQQNASLPGRFDGSRGVGC